MRDRLKNRLRTGSILTLAASLISCDLTERPTVSERAAPDASTLTTAAPARQIPRRTNPLVITNVPSLDLAGTQTVGEAEVSTNTAPMVTCTAPQSLPCSSPDGVEMTFTARVEDADGDALSVVWNIDGKDRYTQQAPAGTPRTVADVNISYVLTQGDHAVRVTVLDGALSATCDMAITVQGDTIEPAIACPEDVLVRTDPGQCTAMVSFAPKATDNCPDVTVVCDPPSGTAFPIGTTLVTCTATDTAGNTAQCAFNVTVQVTNRCPQSENYWRQHLADWPVSSLQIGNQVYSKTQLQPLLRAPVAADASMVLARQLIVASLNSANGSDPRPICGELAQAHAVLGAFSSKLPYRVSVSSAAGRAMSALATRLGGYNNGILTPNCVP